jgi:hypothetical protein
VKVRRRSLAFRLEATAFEYLRAGFFPDRPAAYAKMLRGLGTVQSVELLERFSRGDDPVVNYRVRVGNRPFLVGLTVNSSGRFSSYSLRPDSPDD